MKLSKVGRWDAAVVWFRRDHLRLADLPALSEAVDGARTVVPLFVMDQRLLAASSPARTWYLRRSLIELDAGLRRRGSRLLLRLGRPEDVVSVARDVGAEVILASREVTPYSYRRDRAVSAALERDGRRLAPWGCARLG